MRLRFLGTAILAATTCTGVTFAQGPAEVAPDRALEGEAATSAPPSQSPALVAPLPTTGPATAQADMAIAPTTTAPAGNASASPALTAPAPSELAANATPPVPEEKTFPSFKFYGHLRLDMTYATKRMAHPQYGFWAQNPTTPGMDEAELVIYPRWTRFGVDVDVAEPADSVKITGKIEIDFHGVATGQSESRAVPRMRHAYGQLAVGDLQILAGQTWDLYAPLLYGGMEQALFWYGGNLGDRRPQLRLSYGPKMGDAQVVVAAAAAQSGAVDMADLDADGEMDGQASARPALQGLAELRYMLDDDPKAKPFRLGVSGHYGAKRFAVGGDDETFLVLAGVLHLEIPVSVVTLSAEAYMGKNMQDVRGGIGQGIRLRDPDGDEAWDEADSIPARGGFVQLQVDPIAWYSLQLGAGLDDPKDVDPGARELNRTIHFGNAFKPFKSFIVGAVYDYYNTTYAEASRHGKSHRGTLYTMVPF